RREYGHADLHAWNHKQVVMEYDMTDNSVAVIRDEKGRWICDAQLIYAKDVFDKTRLDEKRAQRAADAVARLEKKMDEQKARAGIVIDADALVDNARALTTSPMPPDEGGDIDLFDL
ncbi:MAG: Mu transposase C-terminal domain-containing protein, partial [Azoarcus sp.]|nr:Mu transposase C-terminal domain-containing protein [Azoarcus sp.]